MKEIMTVVSTQIRQVSIENDFVDLLPSQVEDDQPNLSRFQKSKS